MFLLCQPAATPSAPNLNGSFRPARWPTCIPSIILARTDPHGFYIGKDKYGANILVDFDKRDDDKTSANILILGNSGQGKSYLLKLLLLNFLEAGKSVISLDVEHEQKDMCETVGGLLHGSDGRRVPHQSAGAQVLG